MAKRLISLRELDDLEGLVERHYRLQERLEALESEAAHFDRFIQDASELGQKATQVRGEITATLALILARLKAP